MILNGSEFPHVIITIVSFQSVQEFVAWNDFFHGVLRIQTCEFPHVRWRCNIVLMVVQCLDNTTWSCSASIFFQNAWTGSSNCVISINCSWWTVFMFLNNCTCWCCLIVFVVVILNLLTRSKLFSETLGLRGNTWWLWPNSSTLIAGGASSELRRRFSPSPARRTRDWGMTLHVSSVSARHVIWWPTCSKNQRNVPIFHLNQMGSWNFHSQNEHNPRSKTCMSH